MHPIGMHGLLKIGKFVALALVAHLCFYRRNEIAAATLVGASL
jgi:hypothetical protein